MKDDAPFLYAALPKEKRPTQYDNFVQSLKAPFLLCKNNLSAWQLKQKWTVDNSANAFRTSLVQIQEWFFHGLKQNVRIHVFLRKAYSPEEAEEIALTVKAAQKLNTLHNVEMTPEQANENDFSRERNSRRKRSGKVYDKLSPPLPKFYCDYHNKDGHASLRCFRNPDNRQRRANETRSTPTRIQHVVRKPEETAKDIGEDVLSSDVDLLRITQ